MSPSKRISHLKRCHKNDKPGRSVLKSRWLFWLYPFIGLLALIWFLIRVIPKPSRATYPCQRVAFPVASSFVIWLLGLTGCIVVQRKAKHAFLNSRYVLAIVLLAVSVGFVANFQYAVWALMFKKFGEGGVVPKLHRLIRAAFNKA